MDLVKPYDIHFRVTEVAMRTRGLNHIQIAASDIDLSLAFYTGLLGMRELFRDGGRWSSCKAQKDTILSL